jgi:hypothetical protein
MDASTQTLNYEIHIRGLLGETLLSAFPGLDATRRDGETVLSGALSDQAALFGVLAQVEALGLELLEVRGVRSQEVSMEREE